MLSKLRQVVQPLRRVLAWPFLQLGASPGQVGAVGLAAAAIAAGLLRGGCPRLALGAALCAVATDLVDGEVARRADAESPEGNYLDALGDRVTECLLLLGLLPLAPNLTGLALAGGCLTSYAKARCAGVRLMDNRDWPASGDYPDRAVLILFAYASAPNPAWPLFLLVLLSWSCLWRRTRYAQRLIREAGADELQPYLRGSAWYQRYQQKQSPKNI